MGNIQTRDEKLHFYYDLHSSLHYILSGLYNCLTKLLNIVILRQDKRVVNTQLPKKSELRMGGNLIQGARPIVEYRKHWEELIRTNDKLKIFKISSE